MHSCKYCGSLADQRDHLKPRTYRKHEMGFGVGIGYGHKVETVPCCAECNNKLRGCPDITVMGRARFLILKYLASKFIDLERVTWMCVVAEPTGGQL